MERKSHKICYLHVMVTMKWIQMWFLKVNILERSLSKRQKGAVEKENVRVKALWAQVTFQFISKINTNENKKKLKKSNLEGKGKGTNQNK